MVSQRYDMYRLSLVTLLEGVKQTVQGLWISGREGIPAKRMGLLTNSLELGKDKSVAQLPDLLK